MTRWRPWSAFVVSVLGVALATYLTYTHYATATGAPSVCPLGGVGGNSVVNCQLVLTSGWSSIFGLPVALFGAVFFLFMTVINLPMMWRSTSMWLARIRLYAAVAGMAMVLYLVGVELLALHHICIYCTGVHLLQFALFMLVITGWNDTGWAAAQWADEDERSALRLSA
ncbi:MAG TPA: vitamin K epoxide reductase family protein [Acidimicrobiales bacterium]|nr:vitamin K epoxide reductase family protein [Acidimicrobiales bacterium]